MDWSAEKATLSKMYFLPYSSIRTYSRGNEFAPCEEKYFLLECNSFLKGLHCQMSKEGLQKLFPFVKIKDKLKRAKNLQSVSIPHKCTTWWIKYELIHEKSGYRNVHLHMQCNRLTWLAISGFYTKGQISQRRIWP